MPRRVDVVVIGGGISGVAAAWEFARRGNSVAVVEKGVIGGEQSSRNWGWCRQQNRDERELPLAILAMQMWDELTAEVGDVGFHRSGLVYTSNSAADLAAWEAWGQMARPRRRQPDALGHRSRRLAAPPWAWLERWGPFPD